MWDVSLGFLSAQWSLDLVPTCVGEMVNNYILQPLVRDLLVVTFPRFSTATS